MIKIFANMKMNLSYNEIKDYINQTKEFKDNFVVIPSSIYIPYFKENNYHIGIQNISKYDNGAYTGDISTTQVKSLDIDYVLIGHSERRLVFNETLEDINTKMIKSKEQDLKIILCIGETKKQKIEGLTKQVLKEQIESAFKNINSISNIIIAYEPVWSIGTGIIPTNDDIFDITNYIKQIINNIYNKDIDVLYGGSVNEKNIKDLNLISNLSGYLIGGASLNPNKLYKIIEETK